MARILTTDDIVYTADRTVVTELLATDDVIIYDRVNNILKKISKSDMQEALGVFGVNQTWQDVIFIRERDTVYTNSTEKPIMVSILGASVTGSYVLYVDNIAVSQFYRELGTMALTTIVPSGSTYKYTAPADPLFWKELR